MVCDGGKRAFRSPLSNDKETKRQMSIGKYTAAANHAFTLAKEHAVYEKFSLRE